MQRGGLTSVSSFKKIVEFAKNTATPFSCCGKVELEKEMDYP